MGEIPVSRGEAGVAELALDDRHLDAFHRECLGVAEPMGVDPFRDTGLSGNSGEKRAQI